MSSKLDRSNSTLKLLDVANALEKKSRRHSRLPFTPLDTDVVFEDESTMSLAHACTMQGVAGIIKDQIGDEINHNVDNSVNEADVLRKKIVDLETDLQRQTNICTALQNQVETTLINLGGLPNSDLTQLSTARTHQLQDAEHELGEVGRSFATLVNVLDTGDGDGKPIDWMKNMVSECDTSQIDGNVDEDAFSDRHKLKQLALDIESHLKVIASTPILKKHSVLSTESMPRIMQPKKVEETD